ncbi:MAG: carboxypeptidase regulatory-like domain-containing protein [Thermoanaerobaculia bacterium]
MLIRFLAYAFALSAALPAGTGGVSGKVTVVKAGEPLPDASNTVVWIEGLTLPAAKPGVVRAEMKSQRKSFQPRVIALPREGAVDFPNVDPIFHNVFSVSAGNRFDLGLYRSGTSKPNVFHETGLVRVYCNIHPTMVGFILVVDSSFLAVTGKDGAFRFEAVPPGSYTLKVWHEEGGEARLPAKVRAGADAAIAFTLDTTQYKAQPHKNKYGKDYPPPPPDDERY